MKNMDGKNNYLNDRQNFELIVWLKNNQISLEVHKATMIVAAEMASHDLGFLVTEGNIRGKLEQFPECRWKKTRSEQKETALTERIEYLEETVAAQAVTISEIYVICKKLESRQPATNGRLFEVTR